MESFKRPGGRRVLLPAEIQLCKTIGITEDEYWYFVELTQAYNGKRPKEYDDIPYIINMPQVLFVGGAISGGLTVAGQIILGVVLTVVSVLLTPKPRAPKTPPSLTTAGQTGPKRFAPQTGFNSVQELATLGEVIPLIFTKQEITKTPDYIEVSGGIRVNTRLLWSQMISLGSSQQLKALFMIGLGPLSSKPDFSGYAIGDLLLKNYINKKLALYMRKIGGRPKEIHRYDEGTLPKQKDRNGSIMNDVMSVDWDAADNGSGAASDSIVSGTRTPNTQVQFGAYSPMPNSMRYRVPYELVLKQKNLESDNKKDINKKRNKIKTNFPRYCSFYALNDVKEDKTDAPLNVDDTIRYTIADFDTEEEFEGDFEPWGVEDVKSAVDATREEADDAIQIGESYLAGSALVVCIDRSNTIWKSKTYQNSYFKCDTPGVVDIRTGTADLKGAHKGYELLTLQKAAIGTISNTKVCNVTEIGLKSKVFKQVTSFPNVNSHPGAVEMDGVPQDSTKGVVKRYQDDDGNIALGPMSKYLMRYSFFRLQARIAGVGDIDWQYIDKGQPFAIKGNLPQPQYNFIRINHYNSADREFEFRFIPFPGNLIKRNFVDKNKAVRILNAAEDLESYEVSKVGQDYEIFYRGTDRKLRRGDVSNTEWYLGALPTADKEGKVKDFVKTKQGNIPLEKRWVAVDVRVSNLDNNFKSGKEAELRIKKGFNNKSKWIWGYPKKSGWVDDKKQNEASKNLNGTIKNDGSNTSKIGTYCIKRNGFKYCNGEFLGTKDLNNFGKWNVWGVTKYEYKKTNVLPQVYDNYQVNGGSGQDLTVTLKVYRDPDNNKFKAARWEVKNSGKNYKDSDQVSIPKTGNAASDFPGIKNLNIITDFNDFVTEPWPKGKNLNPFDAINDYYQYDAERSSHLDGPEHEIVYVNEQSDLGEGSEPTYDFNTPKAGIANVALRLSSSKEWNSFSQLSVYIKKGLKINRLINDKGETVTDNNKGTEGVDSDGSGPTNNFAEIVHALLTEEKFGLVDSIGATSVDKERMITAAKFCEANGFYWDGVITDKQNIREFIYQNALFNLLDFTILGGKFSLFPSVPFNAEFEIDGTIKPKVCALFTDGNTRNLKVSFLSPEERQNFIGTAYYRQEVENGFPTTESCILHVADVKSPEKLPIEVFDMSDFCTNKKHAKDFLQHALKIREKVDHGINFETTPQAIVGLKPGDYIRFISEATHTNRFENGVISPDGLVQSVGNSSLTNVNIYHWKPGTDEVLEGILNVENGKATDAKFYGSVFTVKQTSESNRLYKVESLAYNEEGLITVGASHAPLLDDGTLATINYGQDDFDEL
jgi:hypothetical protein